MTTTAHTAAALDDESGLWLPPRRMKRYERAKLIGSLLIAGIFVGWLVLQWSNPFMRYLSITLMCITAWVWISSTVADRIRARGRQVAIEGTSLHILTPTGQVFLKLDEAARVQWHDGPEPAGGLWFYDASNKSIAHLDLYFFNDDTEARTFVGWIRRKTGVTLNVHWPREDHRACPTR